MTDAKRGIQSIENVGLILSAMIKTPRPMMLKELADATGFTGGQLHAYLVSLKQIGIVDQENGQGKYLLGPFALSLGFARMRSYDPLFNASTVAHELALDNNLLLTVSVWDQSKPIIVQVHRGAYDIHVPLQIGSSYQLMGSAAGQLFAAILPKELLLPNLEVELRAGYRPRGRQFPASLSEWQAEAARIRERGYSIMENSPYEGLNAASFPVFDANGAIQFSLTAIGVASDFHLTATDPRLQKLNKTCQDMSRELGYEPTERERSVLRAE